MAFGTVVIGEREIDIALIHCTPYESIVNELYRPFSVELDTRTHFGNARCWNEALPKIDLRFRGTRSAKIGRELLLQDFKSDSRHSIERAFGRDKIPESRSLLS